MHLIGHSLLLHSGDNKHKADVEAARSVDKLRRHKVNDKKAAEFWNHVCLV